MREKSEMTFMFGIFCAYGESDKTAKGRIFLIIYTVKPGDTVTSLAAAYGLDVAAVINDNGLPPDGQLVVGQSLALLFPEEVYTASGGESVGEVAGRFETTERALYRNNYFLGGRPTLATGDRVVIRYEIEPQRPAFLGGYAYDFIDQSLLEAVISYMTYLMPFTYGFSADGELVMPNDARLIETAVRYGTKPLMHLSTLTPDGYFSNEAAHALFASPEAIRRLQQNILENIRAKGYVGLDVDFEYLFAEDKDAYAAFIAGTTALLNENGYICVVALPPKTSDNQTGLLYEGIDYAALGEAANYSFLMTYEWGYRLGPPMAVAPIGSVRRVVEYAQSRIPAEKLILGISNYGYDWTLPYVRGESVAPSLSTVEAVNLAREKRAEILFDEAAQSPYFYYTDEDGREHVVWFEDARSYEGKVNLIREYGLVGGFIWDLMRKNPQGFVTLNALLAVE